MTIGSVIESSKYTWLEGLQALDVHTVMILILACLMGAIPMAVLLASPFEKRGEPISALLKGSFIVLCMFIFSFLFYISVQNTAEDTMIDDWQENVAKPYYEQLPLGIKTIDIFSVSGTNNPQDFKIVYVEKMSDGTLINETITAKIIKEVGRTHVTYEYKVLLQDIPNFMEAGHYEEVVRVPVDFDLNRN